MTGLRTRAVAMIGRSSVGVLTVAAALLTVPVAGATPDSDAADTAITQAWTADGGADGELGDKDGDVYQVGDGYGQNFAAGKIYYTEHTGAHFVVGAVLDKYQSLGGPADSDLGFPTADEGAGKAEGSRDSTFSAADDPVIFWTPDNGAWVVRGAINAAWDKLGGSAGVLGVPTADETWKGSTVSQAFTGGEISWDAKSKTFTTSPAELAGQLAGLTVPGNATTAIAAARRAAGGPQGPLGAEEGAQYKVGDKGVGQNYAGGTIFYSPETGAAAVTGPLLAKYRGAGGATGELGLPTASETDGGLAPASRIVTFAAADQPVIFWTPDHGAFIVRGAMNAAWTKLGGATGKLGAPTGDQSVNGDVISQKFTGGSISWNSSTGAFTADPSDLTGQLAGLKVPGADLAKAKTAADHSKWYQFHWWWLLAIIPLVLAIGAIVIAGLLRRRRHAGRATEDEALESHDDFAGDHGEYAEDHFADEHYADEDYGDEHHGDAHFGDEHYSGEDTEGQYFQDDPDSVDTAPNAIAAPHGDDHPAAEDSRPRGLGWAGLGAGLGIAGLGGAAIAHHDHPADEHTGDADDEDEFAEGDEEATSTAIVIPETEGADETVSEEPEESEAIADEPAAPAADERGRNDADAAAAAAAAAESMTPDVEHPDDIGRPDTAGEGESAEPVSGPPSGRHHAAGLDEPETAQMSFRVAFGDGSAPEGYAIKANTKSGEYWVPGSPGYDDAPVEIWFASEEFAITNGFIRG